MKESRVKNRIFYIITSLDYGGTQRQLYTLIKTLLELYGFDYEVFVVSLKKAGRFEEKFKLLGVKIYTLGLSENNLILNILFFLFAWAKLVVLFLAKKPKIVHSFLFQANIFSRFLKILNPRITLVCSERVAEKQKRWQRIFLRLSNFLVDKFLVNSEDLKRFVSLTQKINPKKIEVVPNMLPKGELKLNYSSEYIRKTLGIEQKDFLVLSVGRLHKQKGFDLLLEIVEKFVTTVKSKKYTRKFLFVVVGDGEEMNFLVNCARCLNVDKYVKFLGYKENVYDYINACDLFLLTSYWEGSPNVVLEAIYFRKPIVATRVEGISDYLNDNYTVSLKGDRKEIVLEFVFKILDFYLLEDIPENNYIRCIKADFNILSYMPISVVKKYISLYS